MSLLPSSFIIALLGFLEAYAVATTFAAKKNYKTDANQEFVALGITNVCLNLILCVATFV